MVKSRTTFVSNYKVTLTSISTLCNRLYIILISSIFFINLACYNGSHISLTDLWLSCDNDGMQYVCTGHPALLSGFCYTSVNNMTFLELPYCLLAHHPLVLKQGHKISFDVGAQNADYNNRARCIESKKKKGKIKNAPAISGKTISCHANVLWASGYQKKVERVKEWSSMDFSPTTSIVFK